MHEFVIKGPAFQKAELDSERIRVRALLGVLAALLALVLGRAAISLTQGRQSEAWIYVLIVALMIGYEAMWLKFIETTMRSGGAVSRPIWKAGVLLESLVPTTVLLLQVHSSFVGPERMLTSPVVLAWFLLIILSVLHLDPVLPAMSGAASAAGYAIASIYAFVRFPEMGSGERWWIYFASSSFMLFLLVGGFAAAVVAYRARRYLTVAATEAEIRAGSAHSEHNLETARLVQQGLLPKAPLEIAGFDIAGWNHPADDIGGDYFDWQRLPGGRVALTIADGTGHGIGSALDMATCRSYARAGFAADPELRTLMGSLNQLLYEELPSERFVTMAAGILDPDDATMELISAGHGPLLCYLSAEDRFRTYDAQGLPLGLMPGFKYACPQKLTLAPGDIFVFLTDGFVEWANVQDENFGKDRLKNVIRANRDRPSSAIISELYTAVRTFAQPASQPDDLTVLVVKRLCARKYGERLKEIHLIEK